MARCAAAAVLQASAAVLHAVMIVVAGAGAGTAGPGREWDVSLATDTRHSRHSRHGGGPDTLT